MTCFDLSKRVIISVNDCITTTDYCQVDDLMVAVWQETKENGIPQLYLLSFDLNQWYHCQMPSSTE